MKTLTTLFRNVAIQLTGPLRRISKDFARKAACLLLFAAGFVALLAGTMKIAAQSGSGSKSKILAPNTVVSFGAGSLIIPMDIGPSSQDNGMLRAYGLVYALLRNRVPVNWIINPAKVAGGDDFQISTPTSLQDVRTGATVTSPRSYRGGPFVIAASDAAAALPIIISWQATAGDQTAVHRFIGAGSFNGDVARFLISAPRIGILKDGNETIAFSNLNAAAIPDSTGALWTAASPDLLTEAAVAGPTTSNHKDGVLFNGPGGSDRYCYLASMHYISTATTPEVVQEFRAALASDSSEHAFMQCEAILAFENDGAGGLFLSTAGLVDDGSATASPVIRVPSNPLAQLDGLFEVDSGAVDSIGLGGGSSFRTGVTTLINDSASSLLQRIVLLTGRLDGVSGNGRVTYLAGHDYSVSLPVSTNPQTNGVRLFLNSIFESDCAIDAGQPDVTLTKSAPATINGSTISYTINYSNPGPRPAESIQLTDKLPAGATYVAGSGVPPPTSNAGGVLTWDLPSLASGAMASVTFQVSVSADGSYSNTAQMNFAHLVVRQVSSNTIVTVRDTVPPTVTITVGPGGATNNNMPTFEFITGGGAVSTTCHVDGDPSVSCSSPFTTTALGDGPHTFTVQATDAASNTASASRSFTVDTQAPVVSIPVPPNQTTFSTSRPTFVFLDVGPAGTPSTAQCRIDSDALVPCVSPWQTASSLTDGPHTLTVEITDAAGNVGQGSFAFVVDTVAPIVNIPGPPINPNPTSDTTPDLFFTVMNVPATTPIVSTQCRIDGGALSPCTSPFTPASALSVAQHVFEVLATDAAGNVGDAFYVFTVSNPNECMVCHKHTTLILPCNSLEYQRHMDHGDSMGPCPNN